VTKSEFTTEVIGVTFHTVVFHIYI